MHPCFRVLLPLALFTAADAAVADAHAAPAKPKNIIFMLGDGMGAAQVKAYRAWADDPATPVVEPLVIDALQTGAVATDSIVEICEGTPERCVRNPYGVTDSAASATAYATGVDTLKGRIGMDPDEQPLTSVLELAARAGKGTGIVATSQVTHASPAAFIAHVPYRRDYDAIADQYFDNQIDGKPMVHLILGGGMRDFRRDDRDVAADFIASGYELVENRNALLEASELPLLGLFAPVGLPRHWDRPGSVPTLADMSSKALELLSSNEQGFFLMIEGSQIDWAGHGNDIAGVVSEMEGFLEAIERVLAFAAERDDTLIVITADHETGGLSLGADGVYEWNPTALRGLPMTPAGLVQGYLQSRMNSLPDYLQDKLPFTLTGQERGLLVTAGQDGEAIYEAINVLLDERTRTGWSTDGHTGVDVPLYATGPGSAAFTGVLQNETLGKLLIEAVEP